MTVSVFMPSYNKGLYTLDGIRSVLAQDNPDWELWIMDNSTDGTTRDVLRNSGLLNDSRINYEELNLLSRKRDSVNMMGFLLNAYYPRARGEFIFYMSDDDLIDRNCLGTMAGYLDETGYDVCWASLRCTACKGPGDTGPFADKGIPARTIKDSPGSVDNTVDGGQILHRASCLDRISRPYFYEGPDGEQARHIDGIFMERLVSQFPFYPLDKWMMTHRYTPVSTYSAGGPDYVPVHQGT